MKTVPVALALLTAGSLVACSSPAANTTKAGAPLPAVQLGIADAQPLDAPSALVARAMAEHLQDVSHGGFAVGVHAGQTFGAPDHGDARVVAALRSGKVQLATVPTRTWSDLGVHSTDVLQAPFEVTSNAHMVAVAQDERLVDGALSGLGALGVHGLALAPESLRYLVGFGKPVDRPADLVGNFQTLTSSEGAIVADLGATPINPPDEEYAELRARGQVRATETDLQRAAGIASDTTASVDLALYAKFVSIVANEDWWAGLTAQQRGWVTAAADAATRDTVRALRPRSDEARAYCNAGGSIRQAGPDAVNAFKQALRARTDAVDPTLLARLRADRPDTEEDPPAGCAPPPEGLDPTTVRPAGGDLPDGVYRYRWTEAWARRWNATTDGIRFEGQDAPGTFKVITVTWTLRKGRYTFAIAHDDNAPFVVRGIYQVAGDQMLLDLAPDIGDVVNRLQWRVNPDESLTMTQVDGLKQDPYYGIRWTRIGRT